MLSNTLQEKLLREYVSSLLLEAYEDIIDIGIVLRVSLSEVSISDILTDIRGIKNVITVNQESTLEKQLGQEYQVRIKVSYEQDDTIAQEEILQDIQDTLGVKSLVLKGSQERSGGSVN